MSPIEVLRKYWGYPAFRPLQEDIIQTVVSGKDCLALLPTGGGKSICFQVPGLMLEGPTLVISPLIALMQDQVAQLQARGIKAVALSSSMPASELNLALDNMMTGAYDFIYLAPERLASANFKARIQYLKPGLIAIDEAHCISQWGYDFRPAYRKIKELREIHPEVPVLALTASATPAVCEDICKQLEIGQVLKKSFVRNNLSFTLRETENRYSEIAHILNSVPGSSVVYTRSRKACRQIAEYLQNEGISADYYHAGLKSEERERAQDEWISNKTRVILATNAFGMGIDKPDVRTVIHYQAPDSLEAYYQEAGRAGRDGKKAYAVLLLSPSTLKSIESKKIEIPEMREIRRVYECLGSYFKIPVGGGQFTYHPFDQVDFMKRYELDEETVNRSMQVLALQGIITHELSQESHSRLRIRASREVVYDYQVRFPKMDIILKALLRSYGGIFDSMVPVKEDKLARALKTSKTEFIKALRKLDQDEIIYYSEKRDLPLLGFLEAKEPKGHLLVKKDLLIWLKRMYKDRNEAMLNFLTQDSCRMQGIVAYFGEEAAPCGICDWCVREKKAHSYQNLDQELLKALKESSPISSQELLQKYPRSIHANIGQSLRNLIDQEKVILGKGQILHLPNEN